MGCSVGMNPYATRTMEPRKAKNQGLHSLTVCHTSQPPPTSATPAKINRHIVMITVPAFQLVVEESSSSQVDMRNALPSSEQVRVQTRPQRKHCPYPIVTSIFMDSTLPGNENAYLGVKRQGDLPWLSLPQLQHHGEV